MSGTSSGLPGPGLGGVGGSFGALGMHGSISPTHLNALSLCHSDSKSGSPFPGPELHLCLYIKISRGMNTVHNGLSFSEGFLMDMTFSFLSTIVVCVHDREQARTFQQITSGNCLKASYPELGRGSSASSQLGMGPSVHAHGSFELSGKSHHTAWAHGAMIRYWVARPEASRRAWASSG